MLFNSLIFLVVFFPITLGGYFLLAKMHKTFAARGFLAAASLVFYGAWDWHYVPLLLLSIFCNYLVGERIIKNLGSRSCKWWLYSGIFGDLALLVWFKYVDFFIQSGNYFFESAWQPMGVILPLGISFYTFTQIAYLVDASRGDVRHTDPITYGLFVTYFPHLIAGPIIHHKAMMPQFLAVRKYVFSHRNFSIGMSWFVIGLSKKLLIADPLSGLADQTFEHADSASAVLAWIGVFAYSLQLYFDFSGYSDMAIGLARCFNHDLPLNFASPYRANSISEFWRRWHMSLSSFLRDYLYIPLGGNRRGKFRQIFNLMITMLLGGLWHGAGWTYVLWGGLHGIYLVIDHRWKRTGISIPTFISWPLTLLAVVVGWVFFRATTLEEAGSILTAMSGFGEGTWYGAWKWREIATLTIAGGIALFSLNTQQIMTYFQPTWWWLITILGLFLVCVSRFNTESPFLYFQF